MTSNLSKTFKSFLSDSVHSSVTVFKPRSSQLFIPIAPLWPANSVTRLGDLLDFGQLFKACGNNQFAQISHIIRHFCNGVKIFNFSS